MYNKGLCQCGSIEFEFEGEYFLTFCHCKICQKLHGSAFAPMLHAESKTFKWLKGEEFLSYFNSSPNLQRVFCSQCGSNLPIVSHSLNHIAVPASAMDTPVEQQPVAHFYTRSKASWFLIDDDALQYETIPLGGIGEVYVRVLSMNEKLDGTGSQSNLLSVEIGARLASGGQHRAAAQPNSMRSEPMAATDDLSSQRF